MKTIFVFALVGVLHIHCAECKKKIAWAIGWSGLDDDLTSWDCCSGCKQKINREEVDEVYMAYKKSLYEDYQSGQKEDDGEDLEFDLRQEI